MAKSLPTLVAFFLSVLGVNMFGASYVQSSGFGDLGTSYLIKLGMYFLLLDVNLYQKSFKKLHYMPLFIYELILASFFMDTIVYYIWLPLEKYLICHVPRLAKLLCLTMIKRSITTQFLEILIKIAFGSIMMRIYCYIISIIFVICVLHATRAVDFRLLRYCGIRIFISDVTQRFHEGFRKIYLSKNRLKEIKVKRTHKRVARKRRYTYCD